MRVSRTIDRQNNDEDDVGRAAYTPPPNDQDVCCTFLGTVYSGQRVREALLSAAFGAAASAGAYSALYTLVGSDLFAGLVAAALVVGAAVVFHKANAPRINRTPLKGLVYKMAAGISALSAFLALLLRFDRRSWADPTAPYVSSLGPMLTTIIATLIAGCLSFLTSTLFCDFYNKNFSKEALDDAAIDPSNEHGEQGISELCAAQMKAVLVACAIVGAANGLVFDVKEAAGAATMAFVCKHLVVSVFAGLIGGVLLGNANFTAEEENDSGAGRRNGV